MNFGTLLHTAQKNEASGQKQPVRYYSTKFEPPKKEQRGKKEVSVNVQKFLARKEAEEKAKREEEARKRDNLLALRSQDKKAVRRVNVMLKRTKSASQSVLRSDEVESTNVVPDTWSGPEAPVQDDYGYVSNEAAALYNKMMEKYSKMPVDEEPKFKSDGKRKVVDLKTTKERVKAALEQEQEEANGPHRRKRKRKDESGGDEHKDGGGDASGGKDELEEKSPKVDQQQQPPPKPKKPKPMMPPPMNFNELLKLAEKKQFEPIVIEVKPKDERPLTKKQRLEIERERESLERRQARGHTLAPPTDISGGSTKPPPNKIPKLNSTGGNTDNNGSTKNDIKNNGAVKNNPVVVKDQQGKNRPLMDINPNRKPSTLPPGKPEHKLTNSSAKPSAPQDSSRKPGFESNTKIPSKKDSPSVPGAPPSKKMNNGSAISSPNSSSNNSSHGANKLYGALTKPRDNQPSKLQPVFKQPSIPGPSKPKEFPPKDLVPKNKPSSLEQSAKVRPTGSAGNVVNSKPKQFPPADVRRKPNMADGAPSSRDFHNRMRQKPAVVVNRGRILDDDDDDEDYDSEMDDFIDDGPQDGDDVSKYISEIFGYDKSKYRDVDDDIDNMESTFAQQMREECISTKIGKMEDLEDMKLEEEEKKRKAFLKKKRKL